MYPIIFNLPDWFPLLGGEAITSFGVFMLFAFLTGGYVIRAGMREIGEDPDKAWDLVSWELLVNPVPAKRFAVIACLDYYLHPLRASNLALPCLRAGICYICQRKNCAKLGEIVLP